MKHCEVVDRAADDPTRASKGYFFPYQTNIIYRPNIKTKEVEGKPY